MREMTEQEWRTFLARGTLTGKLATVRRDGRPHVMPVWFVVDDEALVFMTGARTVKGRTLRRTGRASLCVDDQQPPFSFVTVSGPVSIHEDLDEMLPWSIRIADRYMGTDRAEEFGRRNAGAGRLLVRLRIENVVAVRDIA
jgi:PPOX class probable F420-dependent enzyme